jgi:hypothetical protein
MKGGLAYPADILTKNRSTFPSELHPEQMQLKTKLHGE